MSIKSNDKIELIRKHVGEYPDFPKPGVLFRDIFSVFREPKILAILREVICEHVKSLPAIDCVAALDARGFLLGPIIALDFQVPFVPIRKKGKLPGKVSNASYKLEYGEDILEIQQGSVKEGSKVLLVDDLLATGGSLGAACELIKKEKADVVECLVVMELVALNGRVKLKAPIHSLLTY